MSEQVVDGGADPKANGGAVSGKDKDTGFEALKAEKKLLAEKAAKLEAELGKIQEEKRVKEEEALKQKGEYKSLYEKELADKQKVLDELDKRKKREITEEKVNIVLKELGGELEYAECLGLIDFNRIPVDESGKIDLNVAKEVASEFQKKYPKLIVSKGLKLPSAAPRGGDYAPKSIDNMNKAELKNEMKNALGALFK